MNPEIFSLARYGVVAARRHPHLVRAINACHHRGELTRLLPGVYTLPHNVDDRDVRLQAVAEYGPDLILTHETAASLTFWPDVALPPHVQAATARAIKSADGFVIEQRYIPPELRLARSRRLMTDAPLTVLDLIPTHGAWIVDEALRRKAVTLAQLWRALRLTPGRPGNVLRREILADSRDLPWSPFEREVHRRMRSAGVTGWVANYPVRANGRDYVLDVALPELLLGFELDGEQYHLNREQFHADRRRDQDLSREGWQIVRFTPQHLDTLEETMRGIIDARRRALARRSPRSA